LVDIVQSEAGSKTNSRSLLMRWSQNPGPALSRALCSDLSHDARRVIAKLPWHFEEGKSPACTGQERPYHQVLLDELRVVVRFDAFSVELDVLLGGLGGVLMTMQRMAVRDMRVMRRGLRVAFGSMFRCGSMVNGGFFVMVRRGSVRFVDRFHWHPFELAGRRESCVDPSPR
jgi:hypothetical protein